MLAAHEVGAAQKAADQLSKIAEELDAPFLRASAAFSQGAVSLAEDDPARALAALRHALSIFGQMDAAYESARVRVLVGQACRALGDSDSAEIEFDAARHVFQQLGATAGYRPATNNDRLSRVELPQRTDDSRAAGTPPRGHGPDQP